MTEVKNHTWICRIIKQWRDSTYYSKTHARMMLRVSLEGIEHPDVECVHLELVDTYFSGSEFLPQDLGFWHHGFHTVNVSFENGETYLAKSTRHDSSSIRDNKGLIYLHYFKPLILRGYACH